MSTAEFRARLRIHAQSIGLLDSREVVRVIIGQGRGVTQQPVLTSVQRDIERLLHGKTRIYRASAGNVVNLRTDAVSMKGLLPSIHRLSVAALKSACDAMQEASQLPLVAYWYNPFSGDDPFLNFNEATTGSVASPDYLQWALAASQASWSDQRTGRAYSEVEAALIRPMDPPEEQIPRQVIDAELMDIRMAMSSRIGELIDQRPCRTDGRWPWLQPFHSGANPWPFPGRMRASADPTSLLAEASVLHSLGGHLCRPQFDGIGPAAERRGCDEASIQNAQAVDCWSTCLDAGMALKYLAAILRALAEPETARHCDVCYRYVSSGHRTRCELHHSTAGDRTRELRLTAYTIRFNACLQKLHQELGHHATYARPAQALARCWQSARSGKHARVRPGGAERSEISVFDTRAAATLLGEDLARMVHILGPVIGKQLQTRMKRLLEQLTSHVLNVPSAQDAPIPWRLPWLDGENPVSPEQALEILTPRGFFAIWFTGKGLPMALNEFAAGADPGHPFFREGAKNTSPGPVRWRTAYRTGQSVAIDLNLIVRDLVLHRGWIEAGGEQADDAIERGAPVPTDRPRDRLDLQKARILRNKEGKTFREIGAILGVSGPAVYAALKRHQA